MAGGVLIIRTQVLQLTIKSTSVSADHDGGIESRVLLEQQLIDSGGRKVL